MIDIGCLKIKTGIFHSVTCLGCQQSSNRVFSEVIIPIERAAQNIQQGVDNYFNAEIVEDYNCGTYIGKDLNALISDMFMEKSCNIFELQLIDVADIMLHRSSMSSQIFRNIWLFITLG